MKTIKAWTVSTSHRSCAPTAHSSPQPTPQSLKTKMAAGTFSHWAISPALWGSFKYTVTSLMAFIMKPTFYCCPFNPFSFTRPHFSILWSSLISVASADSCLRAFAFRLTFLSLLSLTISHYSTPISSMGTHTTLGNNLIVLIYSPCPFPNTVTSWR